ncbi:MAG TPA: CDP-alcohol phosphatidyltransferase family protein [Gemmatimonadaceae bacterium]|nr:CDP-alcohol phosphatidyltransferase family protein [Gemmatimonadaceae bacterium]
MNLPNAITVGRIVAAPAVALLALLPSWPARLAAFVVFIIAAVTDYIDGKLARERNLVTDLGRVLDPLADKLLLAATVAPLYILQAPAHDVLAPYTASGGFLGLTSLPFRTPIGPVPLPFWIVAIVLGREIAMTVFRQAALRRGTVIAAIGPAKWKTGFQWTWIGSALFWFFATSAFTAASLTPSFVTPASLFIGIVGTVSLLGAIVFSLYSLGLYLGRYGAVIVHPKPSPNHRAN